MANLEARNEVIVDNTTTDIGEEDIKSFQGREIIVGTGKRKILIPGRTRAADTVCLESGCDFTCKRIPCLRDHLTNVHGRSQPIEFFQFSSEEGFLSWLGKIESEYNCSYTRRRGWQKNKNGSRSACYYCHRGGAYTSNASKKQAKLQGSCKIGVECTSSLKVTVWQPPCAEMVQVEAYLQHYGHNFELGHTRINLHDRKEIEKKLKNGVSRHKILDEIRGSLDRPSNLSRKHLISLQDIYNIEKRCGIKASRGRYCSEAGITAQAWIEGMQQSEDNPVLLIKYQQEAATEKYNCLSNDDFLLVLQTPLQAKMLQKFGPRQIMCMDITRGSNETETNTIQSGFLLFSLEVLLSAENDEKEPYPVAWCVSNRKDEKIFKIFFNCIKENLHGFTLTPAYLFIPCTTNVPDCFEIWTKTFGAGPRKLISSWHVTEDWRQNIQLLSPAVYSNAQERSRVLGNLETVIRETSSEHFVLLMKECCSDLSLNVLTSVFGGYFETNYMSQAELWASAYRTEAANVADVCLEAFHARLSRHVYPEALRRKQLDVLVKTLMKYTRDNVLTKLRNSYKGKNEFQLRESTSQSHRESQQLPVDYVIPIKGKENSWHVMAVIKTLTEEQPQVKQLAINHTVAIAPGNNCTARLRCVLRCEQCSACPHIINCTCSKTEKKNEFLPPSDLVMCVHTHQVCQFLKKRKKVTADSLLRVASLVKQSRGVEEARQIHNEPLEVVESVEIDQFENDFIVMSDEADCDDTEENLCVYVVTNPNSPKKEKVIEPEPKVSTKGNVFLDFSQKRKSSNVLFIPNNVPTKIIKIPPPGGVRVKLEKEGS